MPLTSLVATPWLRDGGALRRTRLLGRAPCRVLAECVGPWIVPALSPRLPVPPALTSLVHALGGRLVVANPIAVANVPREVDALALAVLRRRLDGMLPERLEHADAHAGSAQSSTPGSAAGADVRRTTERRRVASLLAALPAATRDALVAEPPAAWVAAAILEPTGLAPRLADHGGPASATRFVAEPRYRLALAAGHGDPPADWSALAAAAADAPAVPWPSARGHVPWFVTTLLVPDAIAAEGMTDATLARWAAITGRAGRAGVDAPDQYWCADSWERFREPGRVVGHVTPQLVGRSRRVRPSGPVRADGEWGAVALDFNAAVERGTVVPPGYCLVDCVGTLDVVLLTH